MSAYARGRTLDSGALMGSSYSSFFSWICDHRDLHSFPTRRSSDLGAIESSGWTSSCPCSKSGLGSFGALSFWRARRLARRSEEHTSELQSLAYLVCRLLLEKKKRITLQNMRKNILTAGLIPERRFN